MEFGRAPLAAAVALLVGAQAEGARAQSPAPAPQPLPPTVVTATPLGSDLFSSVDPVNVLEGQGLRLRQQPTLGDTVGREVGVSQTWFGPNASRPIIRGLATFDIRVLNNGLGILDASAASPDHAVAVSPFAAERIEVVRGPATVMYGGNAIGGGVNTIDGRIAQEGPSTTATGARTSSPRAALGSAPATRSSCSTSTATGRPTRTSGFRGTPGPGRCSSNGVSPAPPAGCRTARAAPKPTASAAR